MPKKPETIAERTARLRALRLAFEAKQPKPAKREPVLYKLQTIIKVGKHVGKTVELVLDEEPSYIRYIAETWKDVELAPEVEDRLDLVTDVRRGPKAWEV